MINLKKYDCINLFLYLLIVTSIIFLLFPLRYNFNWDEIVYILNTKLIAGERATYNEINFRSPLLSIISMPIAYFKISDQFYKVISYFFTLTLPILAVKLFKFEFKNKKNNLFYVFMILSNCIIQYETRFFLTDIPSLWFILAGLIFYRKSSPITTGIFWGLAILMRLGNIIPIIPIALFSIYSTPIGKKSLFKIIVSISLILLPYQLWIFSQSGNIISNFLLAREYGYLNNKIGFNTFILFIKSFGILSSTLFLYWSIKKREFKYFTLLFAILMLTPTNPKNSRLIIAVMPFFYFFIAKNQILKGKNLIITIMLTIESLSIMLYTNTKFVTNTYATVPNVLSDYILKEFPSKKLVITDYSYPEVAYYTNMNIAFLTKYDSKYYTLKSYLNEIVKPKNYIIVIEKKYKEKASKVEKYKKYKKKIDWNGYFIYDYED